VPEQLYTGLRLILIDEWDAMEERKNNDTYHKANNR